MIGMTTKLHWLSMTVVLALSWSCSSDDGSSGDTKPDGSVSYQACKTDSDCPAGQGCDTAAGSDAYCAPLCSTESECPKGYDCPGLVLGAQATCAGVGAHADGRGVCDLFAGANGPSSCLTAPTEGGTDSAPLDCDAACAHPECPNEQAYCEAWCEMGKIEICSEDAAALSSCFVTGMTCNEAGMVEYPVQCEPALMKFEKCAGCTLPPDVDACSKCKITNCCDEHMAAVNAPNALEFNTCWKPCMDTACLKACIAKYPEAAAAKEAFLVCKSTYCGSVC